MKAQKKRVPEFKNEQEEREFWVLHDSSEFIAWENAKPAIFPDLKPTMKTISLRLPETTKKRFCTKNQRTKTVNIDHLAK